MDPFSQQPAPQEQGTKRWSAPLQDLGRLARTDRGSTRNVACHSDFSKNRPRTTITQNQMAPFPLDIYVKLATQNERRAGRRFPFLPDDFAGLVFSDFARL